MRFDLLGLYEHYHHQSPVQQFTTTPNNSIHKSYLFANSIDDIRMTFKVDAFHRDSNVRVFRIDHQLHLTEGALNLFTALGLLINTKHYCTHCKSASNCHLLIFTTGSLRLDYKNMFPACRKIKIRFGHIDQRTLNNLHNVARDLRTTQNLSREWMSLYLSVSRLHWKKDEEQELANSFEGKNKSFQIDFILFSSISSRNFF